MLLAYCISAAPCLHLHNTGQKPQKQHEHRKNPCCCVLKRNSGPRASCPCYIYDNSQAYDMFAGVPLLVLKQ